MITSSIDTSAEEESIAQTDEDLFLDFQKNGNRASLDVLCRRCEKSLLRYLFSFLRDEELCREALQDTWLSVCKSPHTFKEGIEFSRWLFVIAKRRAFDLRRSLNKHPRNISLDESPLKFSVRSKEPAIDEYLLRAEKREWVHEKIAALSKKHRQLLELRYVEERTHGEIAQIFSTETVVINQRVFKARREFQQIFHQTFLSLFEEAA